MKSFWVEMTLPIQPVISLDIGQKAVAAWFNRISESQMSPNNLYGFRHISFLQMVSSYPAQD